MSGEEAQKAATEMLAKKKARKRRPRLHLVEKTLYIVVLGGGKSRKEVREFDKASEAKSFMSGFRHGSK